MDDRLFVACTGSTHGRRGAILARLFGEWLAVSAYMIRLFGEMMVGELPGTGNGAGPRPILRRITGLEDEAGPVETVRRLPTYTQRPQLGCTPQRG